MDLDANQLRILIRHDEPAAMVQLIERFYERIYAFLRRLAGNDADAADLTQRTVVQLADRKRELTDARAENERLRIQLASRGANAAGQTPLPPDYIRKSTAQWVGLGTPEQALQSFLWAFRTRNVTNLLRVVTPEAGAQLLQRVNDSSEEFFNEADDLPGLRVVRQRVLPDGSVELDVELIPGSPAPKPLHLRPDGSEWKLDIY